MKKFVFIAAAAAAVLAGCAKNEVTPNYAMQDAVTFGAYNPRTITKGGETDDMNLEALQTHGFGARVIEFYPAVEIGGGTVNGAHVGGHQLVDDQCGCC